jgi:hypothetical protein
MAIQMKKARKILVSERAIMARINRKLAGKEVLKKARGDRQAASVGDYFTVVTKGLGRTSINLEKFAAELGVLQPFETLGAEQKGGK